MSGDILPPEKMQARLAGFEPATCGLEDQSEESSNGENPLKQAYSVAFIIPNFIEFDTLRGNFRAKIFDFWIRCLP